MELINIYGGTNKVMLVVAFLSLNASLDHLNTADYVNAALHV